MARDQARDEKFIREALAAAGVSELVYVTANHYDGGYELRVGSLDGFVEYDAIDNEDVSFAKRYAKK